VIDDDGGMAVELMEIFSQAPMLFRRIPSCSLERWLTTTVNLMPLPKRSGTLWKTTRAYGLHVCGRGVPVYTESVG
jgi:hypothetical protein